MLGVARRDPADQVAGSAAASASSTSGVTSSGLDGLGQPALGELQQDERLEAVSELDGVDLGPNP